MQNILDRAIESVRYSQVAYCKFLSANDSGETNSHQSGILVSTSAGDMLFPNGVEGDIAKREVLVNWQNEVVNTNKFIYYSSKKEYRITCLGRKFKYRRPEMTGSLFVLTKQDDNNYSAFILEDEDSIDEFLSAFNISASETNQTITVTGEVSELLSIEKEYVEKMDGKMPSTSDMSRYAREICDRLNRQCDCIRHPDETLIEWINEEYSLYRTAEQSIYGEKISKGFRTMEEFLDLAKSITNARKSRSGKSLEHHLSEILKENDIPFSEQKVTEVGKTPDFIIPSIDQYHNSSYPEDKLATLAAKTTCKDRWRQILNEADRMRTRPKYLCTLQQGLTESTLEEMEQERVVLVVPQQYISSFPPDRRDKIMSIRSFIETMRMMIE